MRQKTELIIQEVLILRQNLTNRETALGLANEAIKKLEKANQGLEYGESLRNKELIDEELIK